MHQRSSTYEQQHLQRMRRSVPNLIAESTKSQTITTNHASQHHQQLQKHSSSSNFNNYQNTGYTNPSLSSSAISRIYQKQKKTSPSSNHVRHSNKYQQVPAQRTAQPFQSITNPYISKPPSNPRQMSSSQSDLKNLMKSSKQYQPKVSSNSPYNQKLSTSTSSLSPNSNCPIISLNQKCSCCSQMLGQGSAMFIEKLGLAFHLKCFRCSVCSVPLGNGKEGTDVRVSVTNRLHCNNCFSNDLGKIYFNFNFIHFDFANKMSEYAETDYNKKYALNLHNNCEAKKPAQQLYKMFKIPLNKSLSEKKVYDDYLIVPNYLSSSTTLNSCTSSYRKLTSSFNL